MTFSEALQQLERITQWTIEQLAARNLAVQILRGKLAKKPLYLNESFKD